MLKYYTLLSFAIVLEVIGAAYMKVANGFDNLEGTLMGAFCYIVALSCYIILTNNYELGIVNALWAGGGTVLVVLIGSVFFQESMSIIKVAGVLCVVVGMIGLNIPERQHDDKGAW
jgi:small multidrug resistance pump